MTAATARTVTISLPLPPVQLNPNTHIHTRARAKHVKAYRSDAYHAALAQTPLGWKFERATLHIRYLVCMAHPLGLRGRARPIDPDNCIATLKSAIDGALVDSRLLPDDNATRLLGITPQLDRHTRRTCPADCKGSGVTLTLSEVVG